MKWWSYQSRRDADDSRAQPGTQAAGGRGGTRSADRRARAARFAADAIDARELGHQCRAEMALRIGRSEAVARFPLTDRHLRIEERLLEAQVGSQILIEERVAEIGPLAL